jgi:hypothetical protein
MKTMRILSGIFAKLFLTENLIESETWQEVMRYENDLHSEWFKRNSENLFKEEFRNYICKKIWLYLINNFCYFTFCVYRYILCKICCKELPS